MDIVFQVPYTSLQKPKEAGISLKEKLVTKTLSSVWAHLPKKWFTVLLHGLVLLYKMFFSYLHYNTESSEMPLRSSSYVCLNSALIGSSGF